jgi:hypothetical protein
MNSFYLNGILWKLEHVNPDSPILMDRDGRFSVATTDPRTRTIYISNRLTGHFKNRVLIHEIGHCVLFSFHLIDDIYCMVKPEYRTEAEEWICNFIADYGMKIFESAYLILGDEAWAYIPRELEKLVG